MPLGGILGGLGGAIGGGIGTLLAGKSGKRDYNKAVQIWEKLETSNFDFRELTPAELEVVAEQLPQVYDAWVPEEVKLAADSPEMRAAQSRGLARMEQVAEEGIPLLDRMAAGEAQDAIRGAGAMGDRAIVRDLEARGLGGSGDEIAARSLSNARQGEEARMLGQDLVRESLGRKDRASQAAFDMGSQVRGQDIDLSAMNARLQNQFNMELADIYNRASEYGAGARERSQDFNTRNRQRVADTNEQARYETELENLNRKNELQDTLFGQEFAKTRGLSDAYTQRGDWYDRRRASRIALGRGVGEGVGQAAGSALGGGYL